MPPSSKFSARFTWIHCQTYDWIHCQTYNWIHCQTYNWIHCRTYNLLCLWYLLSLCWPADFDPWSKEGLTDSWHFTPSERLTLWCVIYSNQQVALLLNMGCSAQFTVWRGLQRPRGGLYCLTMDTVNGRALLFRFSEQWEEFTVWQWIQWPMGEFYYSDSMSNGRRLLFDKVYSI